jgi:protein TonB
MFDVISRDKEGVPHRGRVPLVISTALHLLAIGTVTAVSLVYVGTQLPRIPETLVFVTAVAPPPPPPPAAAAPATDRKVTRPQRTAKPVPIVAHAVQLEPANQIVPSSDDAESGTEEGVPGGVEGGVVGGVLGGVLGGVAPLDAVPPPPVAAERAPIRTGGAIVTPALVSRIDPVYPPIAVSAKVEGTVILEAVVDRDGRVESVTVLRSIPLLDNAAIASVRQWRYSPLLLNGHPERFVLTVTVSFSLKR